MVEMFNSKNKTRQLKPTMKTPADKKKIQRVIKQRFDNIEKVIISTVNCQPRKTRSVAQQSGRSSGSNL